MRKLETAKILLDIGAITLNPVTPYKYASGLLSPIYADCRMISSFPEERRQILDYFIEYIDHAIGRNNIDVVVGNGPSGIFLATYVSERLRLPMAYIRESSKGHGKQNKVEGVVKQGQKALLIGDIFSTEPYTQSSVDTLKSLGAPIVHAMAIFSMDLNIVEKYLDKEGVKHYSLSDLKTLLDFAFFQHRISLVERNAVLDWLADPITWHASRLGGVGEEIAKILLRIKAVTLNVKEPYTYASGIRSPIYCDNRLLMSYPQEWKRIIDSMLSIIVNKIGVSNIDVVAGTATAGISHAAYVAEKLKLPMIYVSGKPKEHGKQRQIEGVLKEGQRVLVIEDLISTGGSSIRAVQAVRDAGGTVENCLAIFTYEMEKARRAFENAGCSIMTLTDFSTLIKVAGEEGYIPQEDERTILEWNKAPAEWGEKMGLSKPTFLGKEVSGKFTIPSGIVTTDAKVIERIAREVPEVGVITTKSIGPVPREGNPDRIITQYAPGCFMNAVGLTNPGAEEFAEQLAGISLPDNRFLLTSIFGGNAEEFVKVAKILAPHSDGLELNLSCPHAKGYGMAIGQDPEAVRGIVSAVKNAVGIPVVAKLTPNAPDIAAIAKAAVEGGADAICAINTVGPGYYTHDGNPVLLNEQGGMSGKGILPIGLKCVKQIRDAVSVPIIGCGGASTAEHVRAYRQAGASVVGIGSGLTGMTTEDLKEYFSALAADVNMGTNDAAAMLQHADTDFQKYRLVENRQIADDMSVLVFDRKIKAEPGQFIFAWVKGCAEKPFSILDDDPLTLAVQKRGCLSETLIRLKEGAEVYFRGPYGHAVKVPAGKKPVLVAGGCGLAAVYMIARENEGAEIFIGARDKEHLFYLENARRVATVHVATEDGSEGQTGRVTDLMRQKLQLMRSKDEIVFYNCGPEPMIKAVTELENRYALSRNIYNSIDYITKCGIGLCGSCATKDGKRLCVDGPFIQEEK